MSSRSQALRRIRSLTGKPPELRLDRLPAEPHRLFYDWLDSALRAGVPEPLAVTFSTVDEHGMPDARVLLLKDFGSRGWAVAGTADSVKGRQVETNPAAALSFWWQPMMRAIRIRGPVSQATEEEAAADFAARNPAAQAGVDPAQWRLWWIEPQRVEFWQGATDRAHHRIVYTPQETGWGIEVTRGDRPVDIPRSGA